MKLFLSKLGTYGIIMFAAMCFSILAHFACYFVLMIFELSLFGERLVKFSVGFLGIVFILILMAYREGYAKRYFPVSQSFVAVIVLILMHLALAHLFKYATYIYGTASEYLSALIFYGNSVAEESIPNTIRDISLIVLDVTIFAPTILICDYIGSKKRQKEIAAMKIEGSESRSEHLY